MQGKTLTLQEILEGKEKRTRAVRDLIARFQSPVVSVSMNIAGAVKDSLLIRRCFSLLVSKILKGIPEADLLYREISFPATGPRCLLSVKGNALDIRRYLAGIESSSPAGRLLDADVTAADQTPVSRAALGFPERACLVCGKAGRYCARSMAHPLEEVLEKSEALMNGEIRSFGPEGNEFAERIAGDAVRALLKEVHVTPKPGLVDEANAGSHRDMDLSLMEKSAEALRPYFETAVLIGYETAGLEPEDAFPLLRMAGREAEDVMFQATGGVNTHKGAVYLFGILLGAVGRLSANGLFPGSAARHAGAEAIPMILEEAKRIAADAVRQDLDAVPEIPETLFSGEAAADRDLISSIKRSTGMTSGEVIYRLYGNAGVRGEVLEGFPSVRKALSPLLSGEMGPDRFLSNDALVRTLLMFIAEGRDTNLIARGGFEGAKKAAGTVRSLLKNDDLDSEALRALDQAFIAENLSPGGSADLLAVTVFLAGLF